MAEFETYLREAEAKVHVAGVVAEKDFTFGTDDNGKENVTGSITIKTSDVNFLKFNVSARKLTNKNEENPSYASLKTVDEEYQSISDVGEENATRVAFTGNLNPYVNRNGQEVVGYRASFISRYNGDPEMFEPKAEFEVEMFIEAIVPEMDKDGIETGRLLVKGQVPSYGNGINPITLAADGEVADGVDALFQPGQTARFLGDVVNNRITVVKEIPVAIGKPRKEVYTEFKNDMIITGASEPYAEDGVGNSAPYTRDVIERAKNEKEMARQAKQNGAGAAKPNNRPSAAKSGRSARSLSSFM